MSTDASQGRSDTNGNCALWRSVEDHIMRKYCCLFHLVGIHGEERRMNSASQSDSDDNDDQSDKPTTVRLNCGGNGVMEPLLISV